MFMNQGWISVEELRFAYKKWNNSVNFFMNFFQCHFSHTSTYPLHIYDWPTLAPSVVRFHYYKYYVIPKNKVFDLTQNLQATKPRLLNIPRTSWMRRSVHKEDTESYTNNVRHVEHKAENSKSQNQ
jgi:hypothetical protein